MAETSKGQKKQNQQKNQQPDKNSVSSAAARAEKAEQARRRQVQGNAADYKARLRSRRRTRARRILIIVSAVILAAAVVLFYLEKRTFHNYKILETSEQEDIVSTRYVEMAGNILRYSPDGLSLQTNDMETLWSETYSMTNPIADVRGDHAVIADKDGTTMVIADKNGVTGTSTTPYTIVKVRVSDGGLVAAILDSGDDTWIDFFAQDGSLIAENQTKIDDPGYPMDVAISDDGVIMMVTYQFVDGSETTSYVAFYNFGDVGQNEDDRIVSGYTYDGILIPQIVYLEGSTSVALREDGFTIYKGKQIPKEYKTVSVDKEIISTFYDKKRIGLVFRNDEKEKLYTMKVYNTDGELKFEKDFNIPYTNIRMSDGYILMFNTSQMGVLNSRGVEKYTGTVDGTINNFFKIGWNRYMLVLDSGVNVIKLS